MRSKTHNPLRRNVTVIRSRRDTRVFFGSYRSLTKEFRKIYALNREYMNHEEYVSVLDEPVPQSDYEGPEDDIIPGADPTAVSSQEKQAKLQSIMQIMQMGTVDPMWFTQQYLEAHEIPNADKALRQPSPPPPDPKMEAIKAKAAVDQQKAQMEMQTSSAKLQMEGAAKEQEMAMKARMLQENLKAKQMEAVLKAKAAMSDMQIKGMQTQQNMAEQAMQHRQNLVQQHQTGQQTLRLKEQQAKQQSKGNVKNESSKSR